MQPKECERGPHLDYNVKTPKTRNTEGTIQITVEGELMANCQVHKVKNVNMKSH
jgi:hypothetical protein